MMNHLKGLGPDLMDLAVVLMEEEVPFFSIETLYALWLRCGKDFNTAAYEGLIMKSMESQVAMSGLTLPDTSKYFLRLAQRYRPFNSGTLKGG